MTECLIHVTPDGEYSIDTTYACGLVTVQAGRVKWPAAPIYKWMIGRPFYEVVEILKRNNQLISIVRIARL